MVPATADSGRQSQTKVLTMLGCLEPRAER
ncbi:hypothetical protein Pla144_18770 [Bythopirellula polymerisocia]|uniref:Uncharacterized protein n=1 Tax=Bythopirellula polymerisocia TaxID=2528003 RepID=A0A5C6D081_9BACT|nr:hypothetical protein Pla144_18770 [Bythopirellula polymerisocia]